MRLARPISRLLPPLALVATLIPVPHLSAQDGAPAELSELRERLAAAEERIDFLEDRPLAGSENSVDDRLGSAPESERPWLTLGDGFGASVGGYIDLEYRDQHGSAPTFVQHRFVPMIDASFGERFHFSAEIEFEYGGSDAARDDGEAKVEFAAFDWQIDESFTFRAGALLVPLGRFNVKHDSPLNDFTDRPLVARSVIPTTLTDAGLGGLGSFEFGEEGVISYEVYLVNGFVGLEEDSTTATGFASNFDTSSGIRGGRPSLRRDGSRGIATVGRIEVSPVLGVGFGISSHVGAYDVDGDHDLLISAFDFDIAGAALSDALVGFEMNGEIARADISRDAVARASGVPDDLWGFSFELNHHFLPEALVRSAPKIFSPDSTFTAAIRLEHVELGAERDERVTFGLNFRPIEETVIKFDYQLNFDDGSHSREDDDAFLFSIATYF